MFDALKCRLNVNIYLEVKKTCAIEYCIYLCKCIAKKNGAIDLKCLCQFFKKKNYWQRDCELHNTKMLTKKKWKKIGMR